MTSRLNPITTPRFEVRAEKARRNKEAALAAFIGKKAEIDEMPGVIESAVIGCPHPDFGEAVVAVITPRGQPDPAALIAAMVELGTVPRRRPQHPPATPAG